MGGHRAIPRTPKSHSPADSTLRPRQNQTWTGQRHAKGESRCDLTIGACHATQPHQAIPIVITPLSMYDTLSPNSNSAAEGGRRNECSGGMHHVHREHYSGAYPLAPPHKHTCCHAPGSQRRAAQPLNENYSSKPSANKFPEGQIVFAESGATTKQRKYGATL